MRTAVEAVQHNKLRAALTSLGILFGVASVIAMLAIGRGAEQEILDQMRLLGANVVVVSPLVEQKEGQVKDETKKEPKRFTPGLRYADVDALRRTPEVESASSEIVINSVVAREGRRRSGKLVGVDTSYFRIMNLPIAKGKAFNELHMRDGRPVAIIGQGVRSRFFTTEDPIGRTIKVGDTWLAVV